MVRYMSDGGGRMEEWLPERLKELISGQNFTKNETGISKGRVYVSEDMVLKIEPAHESDESIALLRWLEGRLPVPKVIYSEVHGGESFLLMSRIKGRMACDEYYMERPQLLIPLLAKALKMLWAVDITDCPRMRSLDDELKDAERNVVNGEVDIDMCEPETFGDGGFKDPHELLEWLKDNRPESENVFSHGDMCLPNIMIDNGDISGFIDLGDAGIADKWRDIALCRRSLKHNSDGTYGMKTDLDPDLLFAELGIEKNEEKLRYYILLDELF